MYTKFLLKPFNHETFDCAHLAALYIRSEFDINTDGMDAVSREYDPIKAGECIYKGMIENNMIEVTDNYKKGDVLIYYPNSIGGCCAVCVDDKIALIMGKKSMATHINRLPNIKYHLRHKFLMEK